MGDNVSDIRTHGRIADVPGIGGCQKGDLSETEAIRRARSGDATGFERLYQLHSRHVYTMCLRMAANASEAEDLTQEAFLRVFRKIHTFRGESAFSTWLHRLAINLVLMELRKKKLRAITFEETAKRQDECATTNLEVGGRDSLLVGLVDRVNLDRAVSQLPAAYKIVFVLHDIQGYKHCEIARMLDCSVGASKGQLHRARCFLRRLLQEGKHFLPSVAGLSQKEVCFSPQ